MLDRLKRMLQSDSEKSRDALDNRTRGAQSSLSIGTAMIFESESAEIDKWCSVVLINLMTLARNMIACVPSDARVSILAQDVADELLNEIELLKTLVPEINSKSIADFYYPDYSTIYREYSKTKARVASTPIQKYEASLYHELYRILSKWNDDKEHPLKFRKSNHRLNKDPRETTLFTHVPSDLLSQYQFPKMNLLESHTGRVKIRREWNTKLNHNPDEDVSNIPFCKFTLQIYGDRLFFLTADRKLKAYVKRLAQENDWNALTTESRIRSSINKVKNPTDRQILLSYL